MRLGKGEMMSGSCDAGDKKMKRQHEKCEVVEEDRVGPRVSGNSGISRTSFFGPANALLLSSRDAHQKPPRTSQVFLWLLVKKLQTSRSAKKIKASF